MLVAAVLFLGIAGLIFGLVRFTIPREPTYQGKTLSEWIAPFCRQTAKGLDAPGGPEHFEELQPARNAVRQIGTNAVPILIAKLNHRESAWHRTARELSEKQPYVSLRLPDPYVSKIRAIRALANLGSGAEPAIPSLKAQLSDAALSQHAVYALSGIGTEGLRAMVEQYTNVPARQRIFMALMIVSPSSTYRGENASYPDYETNETTVAVMIEGLSRVAQDRAFGFRIAAIQRLGKCGPQASNAVPVLVQILDEHNLMTRSSTIRALGQIRSRPEIVIPVLTNLLSDPDPGTRMTAGSALREFGLEVPSELPVPRLIHPPPAVPPKERYF